MSFLQGAVTVALLYFVFASGFITSFNGNIPWYIWAGMATIIGWVLIKR